MPGSLIKLTDVGRAAFIGSGNTGTVARKITKIGVATAPFVHNNGLVALPNERKRLDTFSGENVASDTIHVTLRDDTDDQFTLYGFGLYLDNGVLLGTYSQSTPILEKSPQAMLLLSVDMRFVEIDAALIQFGISQWTNPPATEDRQGVVELATAAETQAGTDGVRAVTPAGLASLTATEARAGISALATQAEANAGTDDAKAITPKKLAGKLLPYAPLASPDLTGTPTAPTAVDRTETSQLATTAFAMGNTMSIRGALPTAVHDLNDYQTTGIYHQSTNAAATNSTNYPVGIAGRLVVFSSGNMTYQTYQEYANGGIWFRSRYTTTWNAWRKLAATDSPAFTGTPTVPTAATGTSSDQVASTAFVQQEIAADLAKAAPPMDGVAAVGSSARLAREDHRHPTDTSRAPLASPNFTGSPKAPTPDRFDSSTRLASTEFVLNVGKMMSSITPFTGALTGAVAHVGGHVYGWSGTSNSYSLPDITLNLIPRGATITIGNFGAVPMAIVPQGADKLQTPSTAANTLFVMPPGTSAEVTNVGGNVWFFTGTAVMGSSGQFAFYAGSSGYQKLPSGMILQWLAVLVGFNLPQSKVNLPIAFPDRFLSCVASAGAGINTGTIDRLVGAEPYSLSQVNVTQASPISGSGAVYIFAVGY